jgi:hypothetical protein
VQWKGRLLALLGAAAVAGVAIGFSVGDNGSRRELGSAARPSSATAAATRHSTNEVARSLPTPTTPATATMPNVGTVVRDPRRARFGHALLVGTVDDSLKQGNPTLANAFARISANAGFDAVLVSSLWRRGTTAPAGDERRALANTVAAAEKQGVQVFVFVWHGLSGGTPRTGSQRQQFALYTAALARDFPSIEKIVVGNEPNLNTFWMPQFGRTGSDVAAKNYLDLLARTYDAVKAVSDKIEVIGGALAPRGADRPQLRRHTHSPTQFIKDLGAAYRSSGRTEPVMDAFAIHPYMRTSAFPPTDTHEKSTTITIADYPKLAALLARVFDGTGQRGRGLPVYYTEFGVQTTVPPRHRHAYTQLRAPAALDAVDPETQADYYRQALVIAACQRTVRGFFVFHTFDERDGRGWQSGLYYADRQPKASLTAFRAAAALARRAKLTRCAGGTFVRTE